MSDTRMTINSGNREIILIGTAHVSRESIEEVKRAIREERPSMVCVELDAGRHASMTQKDSWEKLDMVKVFKEGRGFLLMANLVLSGFQRRMGSEMGVKPGEEMKAALETAEELGIPSSLCDREIQITLRRAWARCGLWNKSKLIASLFSSAFTTEKMSAAEIEKLKSRNELEGMMEELSSYLPPVKKTLIDERDHYLAAKIWEACEKSAREKAAPDGASGANNKVIAIVGAGHLNGIRTHLEKMSGGEENADVSALDVLPAPSFFSKAAGWIIPAVIAALVVFGFFRFGGGVSLNMLLRWILWNGSLAAAGSVIALGHPLAVLVSFFGAPVATVNPFIGVGLFSGVTQVSLRKPRVADAETIIDDMGSIKGIYRNRITRALLVFLLSSIGGMAGNVVSIPSIVELLVK